MKKNSKEFIRVLVLAIIFLGINHLTTLYLSNTFIQIGFTLVLSLLLTFLLLGIQKNTSIADIINHVSNINNLDFSIPDNVQIQPEIREKIYKVANQIKTNLKTQVEISSEIFNECENLNHLSIDSLASAELVASSVELADNNTTQQSHMLNDTNNLTNEINKSMMEMEKDIIDKIEFISSSITSAQRGIGKISDIETRMQNSKLMVEQSSEKVIKLRIYSDEVGGLVGLIHSISSETKMLSLNASIEAARAGEEGRGFSVVAMEVGKLAEETDKASKKIEGVIKVLRDEINLISDIMVEEMKYMNENCIVIETTNKDLTSIVSTLNLGKESLEQIKDATGQNNKIIEEVNTNITRIAEFSEETTAQMIQTTEQTLEQHTRAKSLIEVVNNIRNSIYNMQQFVVGNLMEEKMLKQAYLVKDYFKSNSDISANGIENLLVKIGVDAIYVANSSGIVEYTNEKSAQGLDLYRAEPTFLVLKEKKQEYVVTPIKKRVEDGRLFKFLIVVDENGRLFEVGLALDSLIKNI